MNGLIHTVRGARSIRRRRRGHGSYRHVHLAFGSPQLFFNTIEKTENERAAARQSIGMPLRVASAPEEIDSKGRGTRKRDELPSMPVDSRGLFEAAGETV